MSRQRDYIDDWVEQGYIWPKQKAAALRAARVIPDAVEWLQFIERLLLWG